jgi:Holliday junction resolvasome RuvABC endonuclease subunit
MVAAAREWYLLIHQRARVPLDAADALAVAICHVHAGPPRGREPDIGKR